ncbi:MAG: hypothetical protein SNG14_06290 [Rikenellaceae bacterium]
MKKFLTTLFALAVMTTVALAQPSKVAENKIKQMDAQITLTADQKAKLTPVFETQAKEMAEVRKMEAGDEKKAAQKAAFQKSQKAQKEILTPEQNAAWKEYVAKQAAANKN